MDLKNQSIKVSLFFLFTTFGIIISVVFIFITANMTIRNMKTQVAQTLRLETTSGSQKLNDYFEKIRQSIEYLAVNDILKKTDLKEKETKSIIKQLESVRLAYDYMFVYYGLEKNGKALNYPMPKGYDARKRPWYTGAVKSARLTVTEPYEDAATSALVSTVSLPLYIEGVLKGVIAADVSLDNIVSHVFKKSEIFKSAINLIVSDDGKILIARDSRHLNMRFPVEKIRKNDDIISLQFDGSRKYASLKKDNETGFVTASLIDSSEVYRPAIIAIIQIVVAIIAVLVIFIFILNRIMSKLVVKPVIEIANDMEQIKSFNVDNTLAVESKCREISIINDSLENMKKGLRSFGKYVPKDVVYQLIQQNSEAVIGAERKMLSVFFSDIEGFTTLSEKLGPEDLSGLMDDYLGGMTSMLQINNGTVDKYIGDSIMCFWGAPMEESQHAYLACKAALDCQTFLSSFVKVRNNFPRTRIGINSGEAIVGNIGYEDRMSYTALGDPVNVASRIEGLNKIYGTSILISDYTKNLAKDFFIYRTLDTVVVKGKTTGLKIYELVGAAGSLPGYQQSFIDSFNEAMEFYYQKNWKNCSEILHKIRGTKGLDRPLEIILKRVDEFIKNPPSPNFVGTVYMRGK